MDSALLDPFPDAHQIIAFRNVVVDRYFPIDREIVWDAIQNDIPQFITTVSSFLNDE